MNDLTLSAVLLHCTRPFLTTPKLQATPPLECHCMIHCCHKVHCHSTPPPPYTIIGRHATGVQLCKSCMPTADNVSCHEPTASLTSTLPGSPAQHTATITRSPWPYQGLQLICASMTCMQLAIRTTVVGEPLHHIRVAISSCIK